MMEPPLVWIVDDDAEVRRSTQRLLESVGCASQCCGSAKELLEVFDRNRPGCLILDMRLGDTDGLNLLEDLREQGVQTPAIVITAFGDVPSAVRAMRAQALDFIEKPFSQQEFLRLIQRALDLDSKRLQTQSKRQVLKSKLQDLSKREQEVLQGIIEGRSSKMIAQDLAISRKTVENYRANLMRKIGAENAPDLVRIAMEAGLRDAVK